MRTATAFSAAESERRFRITVKSSQVKIAHRGQTSSSKARQHRATNSGATVYNLSAEAAEVLRSFGKANFSKKCENFIEDHGSLSVVYDRARNMAKVPVTLPNGSKLELSPGIHNELQRLIVEDFAPRFARGSVLLYLGDTADKQLFIETGLLESLNIPKLNHFNGDKFLGPYPQRGT